MKRNASHQRLTENNSFCSRAGWDGILTAMHNQHLLTAATFVCGCVLLMPSITLAAPDSPAAPGLLAEPNSAARSVTALPEAPSPQTPQPSASGSAQNSAPPAAESNEGKQTKRILGIVPNFRAVSANEKLPPDTPRDKFKTAIQDSFDYSAIIFAAGQAGVAQAQDSYPEFHQGAAGFGRYFWHTFADQTDENLWVEGILPVALHQDNRYYTLGHGGFVKRSFYSFTRTLETRNDSGNEVPNYSEILGAGTSSSIAALYYPSPYRTWTKIGQRWLTNVIIDGVTFSVKEFWPDVNNAIFHQKD
jgi:hypothetical protein